MAEASPKDDKHNRFSIAFPPDELARIDDWRFAQRYAARAEAIRALIALGLAAHAAGWSPDNAAKKRQRKAP